MASALILLGFDITHAVLTLSKIRPSRAVALLALVDGRLDPRASIAYGSLSQVASAMGVSIEGGEIDVLKVGDAVGKIAGIIKELVRSPPLFIDLGGGMRLLVVETLLAYLSVSEVERKYARLILYIEGANQSLELRPEDVRNILTGFRPALTRIEQEVLDVMKLGREHSLTGIHEALKKQGFNITKQYVHKILRKLESKGYITRTGRGLYVKQPL